MANLIAKDGGKNKKMGCRGWFWRGIKETAFKKNAEYLRN